MATESFEEFCRRHESAVVRSMYLMTGDRQDAWDLAQEAFARAFERWSSVGQLDKPEWWVHKVATNLAISARRRRPVAERLAAPAGVEDALPEPELREAVLALPPAQRAVIVLRFFLDWSVHDTARALRKRQGTIRALTSQGIGTLRRTIPQPEMEV